MLIAVDRLGQHRRISYDTLVHAFGSNIDMTRSWGLAEHCAALTDSASARRLYGTLETLDHVRGSATVCGGVLTGLEVIIEVAEAYPLRGRLGSRLMARPGAHPVTTGLAVVEARDHEARRLR